MKKIYIIVFCKIYGLIKEDFNAMGLLTILMSENIFSLYGYIEIFVFHDKYDRFITKIYAIPIILIVGTFNYLVFCRNKKYEAIFKEFKQNPEMSGKKGSLITASYLIFTFVFLIGLIWAK